MSEKLNNNLTKGGGEETFIIPNNNEVYSANWRDDIVEETEAEEKALGEFETFENESDYRNEKSETAKQPAEADIINIERFLKNRPLMRRLGRVANLASMKEAA